jgi:uncharacterized protein (TIGR02271 family)
MANLINVGRQPSDAAYELQGYEALDNAGTKLGEIESVVADADTHEVRYVVIDSGGWFSSKQFVAPVGDISQVNDAERFVVFERLTKELLGSGAYPRYDERWWQQTDQTPFAAHERAIARAYEPGRAADQAVDYGSELYRSRPWRGEATLQLLAERLVPQTEVYEAGGVRISKRVMTRTETIDVPLREERIVIERLPGAGRVLLGERELADGETLELTVLLERAVVSTEQVVHEEIRVRKEQLQRTEQIEGTVRHEELVVEDAGGNVSERHSGVPAHAYRLTEPATVDGTDTVIAPRWATTQPSAESGTDIARDRGTS